MMQILFLITVDCDLRISSVVTRNESLMSLVKTFDKHGVSGHVTWFLNENDFAITHSHPEFLKEVIERGDTIAIHDHIDFLGSRWEYDAIYDFCSKSLTSVKNWLKENGCSKQISSHRFGCGFQRPAAYKAVVNLGYTISSDVCPETIWHNHTGEQSLDNTSVPIGILPYRHGPESINDYKTNSGPIFQIPYIEATLTRSSQPRFNRKLINSWIAGAESLGQERCVITFAFHPYEVVNISKLRIDPKDIAWLGEVISIMRDDYSAHLVNIEECAAEFIPNEGFALL